MLMDGRRGVACRPASSRRDPHEASGSLPIAANQCQGCLILVWCISDLDLNMHVSGRYVLKLPHQISRTLQLDVWNKCTYMSASGALLASIECWPHASVPLIAFYVHSHVIPWLLTTCLVSLTCLLNVYLRKHGISGRCCDPKEGPESHLRVSVAGSGKESQGDVPPAPSRLN